MQVILIFFLLIVFPICGVQALLKGEIGMGIFFLSPLSIVLCVLTYELLYERPRKKRQEALRKMYNLPGTVANDYGSKWDEEFQKVIKKSIVTTSAPAKLADLQRCQKVAKEMMKDSKSYRLDRPFYLINKAFLLTGCHVTITDSQGKVITKIV